MDGVLTEVFFPLYPLSKVLVSFWIGVVFPMRFGGAIEMAFVILYFSLRVAGFIIVYVKGPRVPYIY